MLISEISVMSDRHFNTQLLNFMFIAVHQIKKPFKNDVQYKKIPFNWSPARSGKADCLAAWFYSDLNIWLSKEDVLH